MHGHKFLWDGVKGEIPSHFHMAAEHMRYERESESKPTASFCVSTKTCACDEKQGWVDGMGVVPRIHSETQFSGHLLPPFMDW